MSQTTGNKKKQKHGWVLEDMSEDTQGFVGEDLDTVSNIKEAEVYGIRKDARDNSGKLDTDVVRKVRIDKQGKAIKIIPRR